MRFNKILKKNSILYEKPIELVLIATDTVGNRV